jgi:hypothetical protein
MLTARSCLMLTWPMALLVAGCGGGSGAQPKPPVTQHGEPPANTALIGHPQVGILRLGRGSSVKRFTIIALPPPQYAWDARVVAPAAANIVVNAHTWYGVDLNVMPSTQDRQNCRIIRQTSSCLAHYPLLEAQRPGRWTVSASKRSGPPAAVRVAITFIRP